MFLTPGSRSARKRTAGGGGGGGTPGGANTNVQFNNAAAFGGDGGFTYNSGVHTTTIFTADTTNLTGALIDGSNSLMQAASVNGPWAFSQIGCSGGFLGNAFATTNGATPGTQTIVGANSGIGGMFGYGSDGVAYRQAAVVRMDVDGTPAANSMPGRTSILTTSAGSITVVERMRIDSNGIVTLRNGAAATSVTGNVNGIVFQDVHDGYGGL